MKSTASDPKGLPTTKRSKIYKSDVEDKIQELLEQNTLGPLELYEFAEYINGKPFPERPLALAELKARVWDVFGCSSTPELKKSSEFKAAMAGREIKLNTKSDWLKIYREWVGVPKEERNKVGPTCINGIDVLENFRPWHIFGLEPGKASADDIKEAFRNLAKQHHPDVGGDPRVMERLQIMRDSLLAFK